MNDLIQWGLAVVLWIQTLRSPWLDEFLLRINVLGDEEFYLLFLPLFFWCLHKQLGARLGVLFLFSMYANQFLKDLFAAPRPYQVDSKLWAPVRQTGYGIPSGHAQGTSTTWGYLATQLRKPLWWTLAIAIPLVVSFGRMYLGDHFPQDVIAGLVLGVVLLALYVWIEPAVEKWVIRRPFGAKLALSLAVPLVLALLHLTMDTAVLIGTWMGFYSALVLEEEWLRFDARAVWWKQVIKLAIGFAFAMGLRIGLKQVFPATELFNLLRYLFIGLWVGLGAPSIFVLLRLSARQQPKPALPVQSELKPA